MTGCKTNSTTPAQCNALLEHYLDLRTEKMGDAGAARRAAARAAAREDGRTDPDVVQVTSECEAQITQAEVQCALGATTVRQWNDCID